MSDDQFYYDFSEFGKYIYYAGIFFIVSFLAGIVGSIGLLVVLIMGLQRIKHVNEKLQNPLLNEFYTRLLAAQIISIISALVMVIGLIVFYINLMTSGGLAYLNTTNPTTFATNPMEIIFSLLAPLIIPLIVGLLLAFVGYGLSYSAWGKLQLFFEQNKNLPSHIRQSASENAGKLKTASLMSLLGFLIITAIIGLIFYILGYFGLGGDLKNLKENPYQTQPSMGWSNPPSTQPSTGWGNPPSTQSQNTNTTKTSTLQPKFCPNCGTYLKEPVKFCPICGNKLQD